MGDGWHRDMGVYVCAYMSVFVSLLFSESPQLMVKMDKEAHNIYQALSLFVRTCVYACRCLCSCL